MAKGAIEMAVQKDQAEVLVTSFADGGANLETVGGKGYSLARLYAADLPVPPGFFVTTAAYRQFVAENNLAGVIRAELAKADGERPATLEACSRAIQNAFHSAAIPAGIRQAVYGAYTLLPGQDPAVAVRSSATAEDLPDLSFAGQQETFLNVSGSNAVLDAVRRCWASLWTARAIGYRIRNGVAQDRISLAAVVQELVDAESAGVLFTANPLNGRRDQAVISAAWGLGEAIVGGLVTPDSITVEKKHGKIVESQTADKQTMVVRRETGTGEQPVPEKKRRAPVLSRRQAADLVRLGDRVERMYGVPMDIEWARRDGKFHLLQARPITTLPKQEGPPVVWELPDPKGKYIRMSIVELLPGPLSPLFSSMGIRFFIEGNKVMAKDMFGSASVIPENYLLEIGGFAYMKVSYTPGEWWAMLRYMVPNMPGMLGKGIPYWRNVGLPKYQDAIARWEGKSLPDLSAGDLLAGARDITNGYAVHIGALMASTMGPSAGSEGMFTQVYNRIAKREGDPEASVFLMGFENAPLRMEKNLYDLAEWCKERGKLAAYLSAVSAEETDASFARGLCPPEVPEPDWEEWRGRLEDHLRRFGHSIYNMDFAEPLPLDNPGPTLQILRRYMAGDIRSPYERERMLTDKREKAMASVRARLKGWKRWAFEKALKWAQTLAPLREDGIAAIGLGYPLLRRMLFELGGRLAQAGMISESNDIFWLEESELESAVSALDRGEPLPDKKDLMARRIAQWTARRIIIPPPTLPPSSKFMGVSVDAFLAAAESDQKQHMLKGIGASAGMVSAPARVLRGPEDFERMQPGEVLVAAITTPAWTPLFTLASAVVTDIGGPLSHSSIVAREYGIPAVLGTGVATKRIRSGQTVTVDGGKGTVTLGDGG
jgi:phosphohistidine swiveling domain-containing protein